MANKFYHAAQEFKQNAKYPKTAAQKAKAKAKRKEGWNQMKKGFKESLIDATIEGGKMLGKYATAGTLFKDSGAISTVKKGLQGAADIAVGLGKIIFNHPDWYLHGGYQNLIAANFALKKGIPSEQQLIYKAYDPNGGPVTYRAVSAPNVMAYYTHPTKPINDQGGWNLGIQRLYNMLRAANAGARNYTIGDLEAYVITQRSILIMLHAVRRIIGTYNYFAYFDVQVPKQLLNAMGVASDSPEELPALINAYNRACAWFSAKFPLKLTVHERDAWLYNNIFCDSDDVKCNYHIYAPCMLDLYYLSNEENTLVPFSGQIAFRGTPGDTYDLSDLTSDLSMLPVLDFSGLFDVIAGDVLKAWGTDSLYVLQQIDNTYKTPIIYDEYALAQIQNIDLMGEVIVSNVDMSDNTFTYSTTDYFSTYNANVNGFWDAEFEASGALNQIKRWMSSEFTTSILNSPTDTQEPGRILSYTRLKATLTSTGTKILIGACGTEFVSLMYAFFTLSKYDANFDTAYEFKFLPMGRFNFAAVTVPYQTAPTADEFEHRTFSAGIQRFAWSNLDWAPRVHFGTLRYSVEMDEWFDSISETLFDFNNYALLDNELIKTYHGIADQSLIYTTVTAKMAGDYQELKF